MDPRPYKPTMEEEIADAAVRLLLAEPEPSRPRLMSWAEGQFERVGLANGGVNLRDPHQFAADLIGNNPMLGDWMRGRIGFDQALEQESFQDLIELLTPAYGDF